MLYNSKIPKIQINSVHNLLCYLLNTPWLTSFDRPTFHVGATTLYRCNNLEAMWTHKHYLEFVKKRQICNCQYINVEFSSFRQVDRRLSNIEWPLKKHIYCIYTVATVYFNALFQFQDLIYNKIMLLENSESEFGIF